jgi:hypothetical protein
VPFKLPLRTNGEVSPGNPSHVRFLLATDLYNEESESEEGLGGNGAGTQGVPTPAGAARDGARRGRIAKEILVNASQDFGAPVLPRDAPATHATPTVPFRYSSETEAAIRDAVVEANYPLACQLFEPSECPKVIDGEEVRRFVSEYPSKVTTTGSKATRLWVCQATAKWAADGTLTYAPDPCRAASTSRDICMRHISTRHLAKVRG